MLQSVQLPVRRQLDALLVKNYTAHQSCSATFDTYVAVHAA